jgi:hypothetical protein
MIGKPYFARSFSWIWTRSASVERHDDPKLPGKPVVVAWQVTDPLSVPLVLRPDASESVQRCR